MRSLIALATVTAATLALIASAASAAPPTKDVFYDSFSFEDTWTCPGITIVQSNEERDTIVEDFVAPQIGVCKHVIADALRMTQAAAMPDHQPAMRTQHGKVIGDRLGVGWADADVH